MWHLTTSAMNIHFYHHIIMEFSACELILRQACVCVCVCVCVGYIYIPSLPTVFLQQEVLTKPPYYVTLCLVFKN
jgi:hypothetical protein